MTTIYFFCIPVMKKIPASFYLRKDVVLIARELIGKIIVSQIEGIRTAGRIVETEAYVAITDKASHSYGGKRTSRNQHMYEIGGTLYVYICYGLHQMVNIVTNEKNIPDAILLRAIEPLEGITEMTRRTGKDRNDKTITRGPGNVGKALGIFKNHSGISLSGNEIFLAEDNFKIHPDRIGISSRIGVESSGSDAALPYRFFLKRNVYVSKGQKSIT
jgi:DNA-3-methyladenine glycosylase